MRHTVHLMFGERAEALLCAIKQYVVKHGSADEQRYFSAMLLKDTDNGAQLYSAELHESDSTTFNSGIDNLYTIVSHPYYELPAEHRDKYLKDMLSMIYNSRVTINNQSDEPRLHVCIYLPLYDTQLWQQVVAILEAADSLNQDFAIDLLMMPSDMAFLFEQDLDTLPLRMGDYQTQTRATIEAAIEARKQYHSLKHLLLMQNSNSEGLSLALNTDSFVRIAGEYALLSVDHYAEMFNPAAQDPNRPLQAIGLSVLSFDRYYFVQYLLHKTYIYLLDREQVMQPTVDVNKVSLEVQKLLSGNINIFTTFYDKHIKPRLDRNERHDDIVVAVKPAFDKMMDDLSELFQSFIDKPEFTLPEKKALMAQLLGEDDELLTGNMFNRDQLVIDDASREALDYFIDANNQLNDLYTPPTDGTPTDLDIERNAIAAFARLSSTSHTPQRSASTILDQLKAVKVDMRESTNYIRLKSDELADLDVQMHENIESQKRLTANGFLFEGHTYQLQHDITENPLDDDYTPLANNTVARVDLRQHFTPIKDQGSLGACSAFALVGIYEYILMKNHSQQADLSEYFVYYNVRRRNGKTGEDTGSSLRDVVLTMQNEGVCTELLSPYSDSDTYEPTDEAYTDGLTRKIVKALNVKNNIDDLKSALAQGYPVAVSLQIFDSFVPREGFVPRPTDEEVATAEASYHAMVLCGYSDEERIFIVRNSWGDKFGIGGYCYIPYSYIEDYLRMACIVTEVSLSNVKVEGNDSHTTFAFDLTNSHIKAAILRNLIDEEKRHLSRTNNRLQQLDREYNQLFQTLGNNSVRIDISDGTMLRLEHECSILTEGHRQLEHERLNALQEFDHQTLSGKIGFWATVAVFVLTYVIALICGARADTLFFNTYSHIAYALMGIGVLLFILWRRKRKHDRVDLDQDYQARIERCKREIQQRQQQMDVTKLKTHTAGLIIDSLAKLYHRLHSKYNGMRSFLGNLRTWRTEEETAVQMDDNVREPFLSLINNECLDHYFEQNCEAIAAPIDLCTMFKDRYVIDEQQIVQFKNGLKQVLVDTLFAMVDDFSIYNHIIGRTQYPYVDNRYNDIHQLLPLMESKSRHFVSTVDTAYMTDAQNASCHLLFIATDSNDANSEWDAACRTDFHFPPSLCRSQSNYKLTILQIDGMKASEVDLMKA